MKLSTKLSLNFAGLFSILFAVLLFLTVFLINSELVKNTFISANNELDFYIEEIYTFNENLENTVKSLSTTPPIQGIIRARLNNGFDKRDNSSINQWKFRLKSIFESIMSNNDFYLQLRFIDEKGNEIVRVDRINNEIINIPQNKLQNKKDRDYFIESIKLDKDKIYISNLELNKEGSPPQIEVPHKAVIRHAVVIFDENNQKRGIVIVNVLLNSFLDGLKKKFSNDLGEIFILDQKGYYLLHPDNKKEFGNPNNLNSGENFKNDFPKLTSLVFSGQKKNLITSSDIVVYSPVFLEEETNFSWIFLIFIPKNQIFKNIVSLKKTLFFISIIILLILLGFTLFVSHSISRPIKNLTSNLSQISKGEFKVKLSKSNIFEIQELTASLNRILVSMKLAISKTGVSKQELGLGKLKKAKKFAEEKYKTLYDSSRDAIMTLAPPSWNFTDGNPATVKLFNTKTKKKFIKTAPWQLSPKFQPTGESSLIKAKKMIEIAMKKGSNFFYWKHKQLNGKTFDATVLLTKIRLEGKSVLLATVREVSKEKIAETSLKKTNKKYKELIKKQNEKIKNEDK